MSTGHRKLILRQKVSVITLLKRRVVNWLGKIIYKLYQIYLYNNITGYIFHEAELTDEMIAHKTSGFKSGAIFDYKREIQNSDIESLSQYYPYFRIEQQHHLSSDLKFRICNVGCFYAGAEAYFLKKHPKCSILGLDFGDIGTINNDLNLPNLELVSGYPLFTLKERSGVELLDYTIFVRTAAAINIEQLLSYMECISKFSTNIIFLESAKLSTSHLREVELSTIDLFSPMKLYGGYYLHNYISLLERFNYNIVDSKVLPSNTFSHSLTLDHDFVYVHGRKMLD